MFLAVVRSDYGYLHIKPRTDSSSGKTLKKKHPKALPQSSWTIPDNYAITVSTASKVNCDTKRASEVSPAALALRLSVAHPCCRW